MDNLILHLRESITVTNDEVDIISKSFKIKTLKKKEILLFKGDVSSHMRFISKGCLGSYYMDEELREHIIQFGIENWWINDLYSYLTKSPARQFIQALENSVILQIHRDTLNALFDQVPAIERFFRFKFEKAYVALQDRAINTMSKSSEERYSDFRSKYRDIEQRVPQYMIASYLGITPEFLSTLRKNSSTTNRS